MTSVSLNPYVHLESLVSYFCNLCSEQFLSSEKLVAHYDDHFSPGSCGGCDRRLILINEEIYHLQLHDISCCDAENKRHSFDEVDVKELILHAPLEASSLEHIPENITAYDNTDDSIWKDFAVKQEYIEPSTSECPNVQSAETVGEHIEMVQCLEIEKKNDCDDFKWEGDLKWDDGDLKVPAKKKINWKKYIPQPTILQPDDESRLPHYLVSNLCGEKRLRAFQCDICKKHLLSKRGIAAHIKRQHIKQSKSACDICGRICTSDSLKKHKQSHSNVRNFICSFCGQRFKEKYHLTEHLNGHLGLRPYKCSECDKTFGRAALRNAHMRIHTGVKPYACKEEGCSRSYAHQSDLKRHLYGQHGIYWKKFECQICAKVFSENKLLTKHMKAHP